MKRNYSIEKIGGLIFLFIAFAITSCTTTQHLSYFNDLPDSTVIHLPPIKQEERLITAGDRLNISIGAKDKEAASYFVKTGGVSVNTEENITNERATRGSDVGYLVDDNGLIEFPIIGKVKATGLTVKQLKENLTTKVSPYLKEPLVDINFVTFSVTVLGEVNSPGTFVLPTQRTTLFEALAAAGDLPRTGSRYNVHLYREFNGQRKITKFDLRKKEVLNNPDVFYLKHNDVLYIQPRPGAALKENVSLYTSAFSILIGIVTLGLTISNN